MDIDADGIANGKLPTSVMLRLPCRRQDDGDVELTQ
jgi:hypothetical protein